MHKNNFIFIIIILLGRKLGVFLLGGQTSKLSKNSRPSLHSWQIQPFKFLRRSIGKRKKRRGDERLTNSGDCRRLGKLSLYMTRSDRMKSFFPQNELIFLLLIFQTLTTKTFENIFLELYKESLKINICFNLFLVEK